MLLELIWYLQSFLWCWWELRCLKYSTRRKTAFSWYSSYSKFWHFCSDNAAIRLLYYNNDQTCYSDCAYLHELRRCYVSMLTTWLSCFYMIVTSLPLLSNFTTIPCCVYYGSQAWVAWTSGLNGAVIRRSVLLRDMAITVPPCTQKQRHFP